MNLNITGKSFSAQRKQKKKRQKKKRSVLLTSEVFSNSPKVIPKIVFTPATPLKRKKLFTPPLNRKLLVPPIQHWENDFSLNRETCNVS